ncbi:hypothetical protein H4W30_006488 [Amycolatopsis roodepoortensis]|uniref:Uncharacterized protein n=1 Tax=Amycolatopsis roodepoortensis TaxID=700274 RepID=A0ABR9LFF5_9PSEU|nr:hypothetical protein [Amycolatopsis roodepoortensis]
MCPYITPPVWAVHAGVTLCTPGGLESR